MRPVLSAESRKTVRKITIAYILLIVIGSFYQNRAPQCDLVRANEIAAPSNPEEIQALRLYPHRPPVVAVAQALP